MHEIIESKVAELRGSCYECQLTGGGDDDIFLRDM